LALSAKQLALQVPPYFGSSKHRASIWFLLIFPFILAIIWFLFFRSWFGVFMAIAIYLWRGFGVTVGNHRLLTHKSFKCKRWVKNTLQIMAGSAVQGANDVWIAVHRIHHLFSDEEGDPHSPHVDPVGKPWGSAWAGKKHAHFWWFLNEYPREQLDKAVPRELEDPTFMWINNRWKLWSTLSFVIPAFVGGVYFHLIGGSILWGILEGLLASGASLFFVGHSTFSINSVCHLIGERPYESTDEARNVPLLAYFTLGESYHHNHHVWEWMAFHGMGWYRDPSEMFIRVMMFFGWAWDPKMPTPKQIADARRQPEAIAA
jgi:stearoyl-CoA desaturase (delta-9 desaturase)